MTLSGHIFTSNLWEQEGHLTVCAPFFFGKHKICLHSGHFLYTLVLRYFTLLICLLKNCLGIAVIFKYFAFSLRRFTMFREKRRNVAHKSREVSSNQISTLPTNILTMANISPQTNKNLYSWSAPYLPYIKRINAALNLNNAVTSFCIFLR